MGTVKPEKTTEKDARASPGKPPEPKKAPRPDSPGKVTYLSLSALRPFDGHPFGIRDDAEMRALAESVKDNGVTQPAIVRPLEDGGYEIICGHRRHKASELAGYSEMPCIVRNMSDDEAALTMTDDNLRRRSEILPSERAQSLKMQLEAVRHQGSRFTDIDSSDIGRRSIEIVGERNGINGKQVQRYIRLTELVPGLIAAVDGRKLGFTPAVEISFIRPANQDRIAVSMDSQETAPSLSQARRMRELDGKGLLNGDVIDGMLCEKKKEEIKVVLTGEELSKYFGKDKTPREMKDRIIALLEEWSAREAAIAAPKRKPAEKEK